MPLLFARIAPDCVRGAGAIDTSLDVRFPDMDTSGGGSDTLTDFWYYERFLHTITPNIVPVGMNPILQAVSVHLALVFDVQELWACSTSSLRNACYESIYA